VGIAGLSFLVAEDEPTQQTLVVKLLKTQGAENVYPAGNGREALDILLKQGTGIDVIVCDLQMPGMDGMQFMRRIGEADYGGSVIIVSALERTLLASAEATAKAYGVNLLGVISKPVSVAALEGLLGNQGAPQVKVKSRPGAAQSFTPAEIAEGLDRDQFEAFFQPKIELATGRVVGAEALARWRHPKQGIVLPASFIKPIEESGKIDDLTSVMLGKGVAFCSAFDKAGLNTVVAVNISLMSLNRGDFADRVSEIVQGQGLGAERICLEITETAATSNLGGTALENLTRLRMMGFGLSIDDLGTAASSIQQLTHIPFTELKIDRSFVANSTTDKTAMDVLKASLDIARQLKIKAVAEGVETLEEWNVLQELGCNLAQGHFIAEAMDAQAYVAWVRSLSMEPIFHSSNSPVQAKSR
jgi:EAL domain-containing protein (putative c-di-GMP-specific phosphodiesterase class I)